MDYSTGPVSETRRGIELDFGGESVTATRINDPPPRNRSVHDAKEYAIGIKHRCFQSDEYDEAGPGDDPVHPCLDFPTINEFTLRVHIR